MINGDNSLKDKDESPARKNYETLIEIIESTLTKLNQSKDRLSPVTCEGLLLSFNELWHEDEIKEAVSNSNWVLEQISQRHFKRHEKLVKLITERFELRRSIIGDAIGPSTIMKNSEIQAKIDTINAEIESIIEKAENEANIDMT
jgi:hypothetical protein